MGEEVLREEVGSFVMTDRTKALVDDIVGMDADKMLASFQSIGSRICCFEAPTAGRMGRARRRGVRGDSLTSAFRTLCRRMEDASVRTMFDVLRRFTGSTVQGVRPRCTPHSRARGGARSARGEQRPHGSARESV